MKRYSVEQSWLMHFLTADKRSAVLWLVVRVYLGWLWISAGWDKFNNPAWFGKGAGAGITGFAQGALHKTAAFCASGAPCHPDVQDWYATFLQHTLLVHPALWSHVITLGEMAVGVGLILGCLVGVAAFFGFFMNLNFMLAGSVSVNPIMMVLAIVLVLSWRVAGYYGLDSVVLPRLQRWR